MYEATSLPDSDPLRRFSNPEEAQRKAKLYLGANTVLYKSQRKTKKYSVLDRSGKKVDFGQMGYEDFTITKSLKKRENYLKRSEKIKGNWKRRQFSPNNLARNILW